MAILFDMLIKYVIDIWRFKSGNRCQHAMCGDSSKAGLLSARAPAGSQGFEGGMGGADAWVRNNSPPYLCVQPGVQNSSSWTCCVCDTVNYHKGQTPRCELCGEPELGSMEAQVIYYVRHRRRILCGGARTSLNFGAAKGEYSCNELRLSVCANVQSERLCNGSEYKMKQRHEWIKSVGGLR